MIKRPTLSLVPTKPGVYRYFDSGERVIYVGKAKNLRNRIGSYFTQGENLHPRTQAMLEQATDLRWTVVESETEALNLEWTWIKQFEPRFNVIFNEDDKSYVYLSISIREEIPRVFFSREKRARGLKNFGPYPKSWAIKRSLDELLKVFPVRTCSNGVFNQAKRLNRPCLLFDIGKCSAPCVGKISLSQHRELVLHLMSFFRGTNLKLLQDLRQQMMLAAKAESYELAAQLRDRIEVLEEVIAQNAVVLDEKLNADVVGIYPDNIEAGVEIFFVREGRIRSERGFVVDINSDLELNDLIESVLLQIYENYSDMAHPKRIFLAKGLNNPQFLGDYLRGVLGSSVRIETPSRGEKAKIVQRALTNAQETLRVHRAKRATNLEARTKALQELQEILGLESAPLRIEGYDISTTLQTNQVGSMVVFEDGIPKKKFYRKFNVDTVDDTSAIYDVIKRRFTDAEIERSRGFDRFAYPTNLIVIDGGLPQVNAAQAALEATGQAEIRAIGLAKKLEEIWIPGAEVPIILARGTPALYLLQQIRDESHRFAITAHRKKRTKSLITSELDAIVGVGPKIRLALLKKFRSVERLRKAQVDEIAQVHGISGKMAQKIHQRLNSQF
jgi:excinuclease ABC subunit C